MGRFSRKGKPPFMEHLECVLCGKETEGWRTARKYLNWPNLAPGARFYTHTFSSTGHQSEGWSMFRHEGMRFYVCPTHNPGRDAAPAQVELFRKLVMDAILKKLKPVVEVVDDVNAKNDAKPVQRARRQTSRRKAEAAA